MSISTKLSFYYLTQVEKKVKMEEVKSAIDDMETLLHKRRAAMKDRLNGEFSTLNAAITTGLSVMTNAIVECQNIQESQKHILQEQDSVLFIKVI